MSKIQFTRNQKKILKSALEPPSTEWLWLKTQNGVSTLYDYVNGKWTAVGGGCRDVNHSSECGDDVLNKGDYVTWNSLSGALDKTMNTMSTWLEGYLKKADFSNYITKDEISNYVSESLGDVLNGYQPLLTPGQSISLSINKGSGSTISVKMDGIGAGKSDPVSGNDVYVELQKINEVLSGKQAKLVSGTNIKKIQTETYTARNQKSTSTHDLLGNGSVSVQAPITDLYAIRNGAAAGATAVQPGNIQKLLSDNLKTINGKSLVGNEDIIIEGGSGGGTSVTVLDPNESPSSNTGVYFFVDSPLQVEGDYNSLLQTGSDSGYTFSPGNLYSLGYSKHTVDGVEKGFLGFNMLGDHTNLDVRDNVVYINGQMTTMKYYGDVVVSNKTKIADTGTFAYISFMVACPFAASETLVTVSVDNTDNATTSFKYLYSNGDWQNLPSSGFVFRNTGGSESITLRVERTDTHYEEKRCIIVHLYNGYSYEDIEVVFNPATVFFKNGRCMNGFNIANINSYVDSIIKNNESDSPDPTIDNIPTNQIVKIDGIRDNKLIIKNNYHTNACLLMTDITIDESDFNVFYVVMERKGKHSWMEVGTYLKGWAGISASESRYRMYGLSVYAPETEILREDLDTILQKRGEFIGKCYCHKERTGGTKTVNMYFIYFDVEMVIQEFGVISYKNSTYPSNL